MTKLSAKQRAKVEQIADTIATIKVGKTVCRGRPFGTGSDLEPRAHNTAMAQSLAGVRARSTAAEHTPDRPFST